VSSLLDWYHYDASNIPYAEYAYFFFYSFVRSTYIKRSTKVGAKPQSLSTAMELILGAVAGALAQIFTIPVSVIATRQQVGRSLASKPSHASVTAPPNIPSDSTQKPLPNVTVAHPSGASSVPDESFLAVAREIIQEDGITGLWLGIHSSLVLTVNPAITYGLFERVKSLFTRGNPDVKLEPWRAFIVGALSKSLATIVITFRIRVVFRGLTTVGRLHIHT
jgi:solute carrier family 25 (peroxisomal adenine nucleotide transporter), member 17